MKYATVLAATVLAALGSVSKCHADTKLLWRTPSSGVAIRSNQASSVSLGKIDVSTSDRLRVIALVRRPANVPANTGFGIPISIELRIAEGDDDLVRLENGLLVLNPTNTAGDVPPRTVSTSSVFDNPVITTLLVNAFGGSSTAQQTVTIDVFVYGQTSAVSATNPRP